MGCCRAGGMLHPVGSSRIATIPSLNGVTPLSPAVGAVNDVTPSSAILARFADSQRHDPCCARRTMFADHASTLRVLPLVLSFSIAEACSSSRAAPGAQPDAGTADAAQPGDASSDDASDAATIAPDPRGWRATGAMKTARLAHTATPLPNGSVLVVGGETAARDMLASVEIYEPPTDSWSAAPSLPAPRSNHAAVLLNDGRVLIAGGGRSAPIGQPSSLEVTGTALLYDAAANVFAPTGSLLTPRSHFGAVLLESGDVLIAGGGAATSHADCGGVPNCGPIADPLASTERFDTASGTWRAAASMKTPRYSFTLTRLADGRVLAVGGVDETTPIGASTRSAEVYDPNADQWTAVADLPVPDREHHSAVLLDDGRLMVVGGKQANIGMIRLVDLFAPAVDAWTATSPLSAVRTAPGLVRLSSGHILAVGGYDQDAAEDVAEAVIYDAASGAWTKIAPLPDGRDSHSTTMLPDGSVLVAGGFAESTGVETATCERSTP
jgi:N-acetylneuraminic acid mutarotase